MDKRRSFRLDKVFPVHLSSVQFGASTAIARNISTGGMLVETRDPLPLGTELRVHFRVPDSEGEIVARAEVKGHYFLNYSDSDGPRTLTGMGLKFVGFEDERGEILGRALAECGAAAPQRTLH